MFRGSNLERYFSRVGASKSSSIDVSSSFAHEISEGFIDGSMGGGHVVTSLSSGTGPREYPVDDPRYIVQPKGPIMHACDTPHSVCNQPRKKRRSNPAVVLLTPERLSVPQTCHETQTFTAPVVELSSDSGPSIFVDDQEETDPEVLEWLTAEKKSKRSYEATRKFQDTWAAKLPWAECVKGVAGLLDHVRCLICRYVTISTSGSCWNFSMSSLLDHACFVLYPAVIPHVLFCIATCCDSSMSSLLGVHV
jgi:hypothetical protein